MIDYPIMYVYAIAIIKIELILISFIVIITVILSIFNKFSRQYHQRIRMSMYYYFLNLISTGESFQPKQFPRRWKNIKIILNVIDELDERNPSNHWQTIRKIFIPAILIPLAKASTFRVTWEFRVYAARAFCLLPNHDYDEFIDTLVGDNITLVLFYAGKAAVINSAEQALGRFITRIAEQHWGTQLMYLGIFDELHPSTRNYFEKKLVTSKDPTIKSVCYKILIKFSPRAITWDIKSDIFSESTELKIAALKYIAYADKIQAIPILIDMLHVKNINIRLIAIHRLGDLQAHQAIPELTKQLNDNDWWVKISAAQALINMGDEGEQALKTSNITYNEISSTLKHVLHTWW